MSLRPRYSLLTLLVVTALVAGGVKLWYGPHHVVEQAKAGEEVEYTFTRAWNGERILQGTFIRRTIQAGSNSVAIDFGFYRNNKNLNWHRLLIINRSAKRMTSKIPGANPYFKLEYLELQPSELIDYLAVVDRECAIWQNQGFKNEAHLISFKPEDW